MASRPFAVSRARLADALTASRFFLAVAVIPAAASETWMLAAVLVAAAWWTDFVDGRLARATTGTKLGALDPIADTAVGVAVAGGLAGGGHVPDLPGFVAAAVLAVVYLTTGNFAFGQLAQAIGYGGLLWHTALEHTVGFALLAITIAAIGVLDRRRFIVHTLPTFFEGIGLRRGR